MESRYKADYEVQEELETLAKSYARADQLERLRGLLACLKVFEQSQLRISVIHAHGIELAGLGE